jgi:acetyl-CoA synthetase
MSESQQEQVSEHQIAVHWREEEYIYPPESFVAQANANDDAIYDRFDEKNFPDCFTEYADLLAWDKKWDTVLDSSNPPFWKWFTGGRLNASYNCVDRHLAERGSKAAIIFVSEPEDEEPVAITYRELYNQVNEFAALLRDYAGLKAGDRVTLHMPMVPELPVTMLACARLGVIHSQVFGGFSGNAAGTRIADSGSRVLITMDGYWRSGSMVDHKVKADEALAEAARQGQEVDKVLVWRRYPGQYASQTPMTEGRDVFVDDVLPKYRRQIVEPVSMPAEAPLFLMYTSGTTGRPKGAQHSTAGYLSYVTATCKYYLDIHPEDTYWCMADIGWITGPPGRGRVPRGARPAGASACGAPGRRSPGRAADARASARVHARTAVDGRRATVRRGLVFGTRDRDRRDGSRREGYLPRARATRRLPDRGGRRCR